MVIDVVCLLIIFAVIHQQYRYLQIFRSYDINISRKKYLNDSLFPVFIHYEMAEFLENKKVHIYMKNINIKKTVRNLLFNPTQKLRILFHEANGRASTLILICSRLWVHPNSKAHSLQVILVERYRKRT